MLKVNLKCRNLTNWVERLEKYFPLAFSCTTHNWWLILNTLKTHETKPRKTNHKVFTRAGPGPVSPPSALPTGPNVFVVAALDPAARAHSLEEFLSRCRPPPKLQAGHRSPAPLTPTLNHDPRESKNRRLLFCFCSVQQRESRAWLPLCGLEKLWAIEASFLQHGKGFSFHP